MSPREKQIAIATGAVIVLWGAYSLAVEPFLEQSKSVNEETADLVDKQTARNRLFDTQARLRRDYKVMTTTGGLTDSPSSAANQVQKALSVWSTDAGLNRRDIQPEHTAVENGYDVGAFRFTAFGSMSSVSKLIWAVESSPIPMRLTDVSLAPEKSGSPTLKLVMTVTTVSKHADPTPTGGGGT